jgi:citrate lyase subunit beta/citryl-CoA lyase
MSERSYLFVPGNRAERFEKAHASGADAVIFDLEDAVQPKEELLARDSVLAHMAPVRPAFVRINAADTEWFGNDVAALASHPGVAGIALPKAEAREQIQAVLAHVHPALTILPIVEAARGFANLTLLCEAPHVQRIVFGTLDFRIDLNVEGDGEELDMFRSAIVLASRLAGLSAPVDGVSTVLDDPVAIESEARRGRRFGFGAKLCVHPKQVDAVHRAYAWTAAEQAWAERVLRAVDAYAGAVVAVDGKMVDMPVILKARRIVGAH